MTDSLQGLVVQMMRLGIVTTGLLLIALAPFALADAPAPVAETAPRGPTAPVATGVQDVGAAAADTAFVTVFDFDYQDDVTGSSVSHVPTGDTVTWFWVEGIHSVTHGVANGAPVPAEFDSGLKRPNDQNPFFTVAFDTPGVYPYYCTLHASMHGTIVVA